MAKNPRNVGKDPFAEMGALDRVKLLAKGAKLRYIDYPRAATQHGKFPDQLRAALKQDYFGDLGDKRVDNSRLDAAIGYGGGYDWAIRPEVAPQDARDMAKAYQLYDYINPFRDNKQDAVADYYHNIAGIEAALQARTGTPLTPEQLLKESRDYGMETSDQYPSFANGGMVKAYNPHNGILKGGLNIVNPKNKVQGPLDIQYNVNNMIVKARNNYGS